MVEYIKEGDKTYRVCTYDCGSKMWIHEGKIHRELGPAVEYENGLGIWYLNGRSYKTEWSKSKVLIDKMLSEKCQKN